jgi:Ca2+-dependent lipid-binding protein
MGGKFLNLDLPIEVTDIDVSGRVSTIYIYILICKIHVRLDLFDQMPFVSQVVAEFNNTKVDLSIKPLQVFDIMDLPFLRDWLCRTVENTLQSSPIKVNLAGDQPDSGT